MLAKAIYMDSMNRDAKIGDSLSRWLCSLTCGEGRPQTLELRRRLAGRFLQTRFADVRIASLSFVSMIRRLESCRV